MILTISIVVGVIALIVFLLLIEDKLNKLIPIICSGVLIGLLTFMILWRFNDYNLNYLSQYDDYTKIELTKVNLDSGLWGEIYEFILTYEDGERVSGFLNIEKPIPFESPGDFNFWLKDINSETLYALLFNKSSERGEKLLEEFITNHFTKEEIQKVSNKTDEVKTTITHKVK